MIDGEIGEQLKQSIRDAVASDSVELMELRGKMKALRQKVRRIQPRRSTAISVVATDGGNNGVAFDPFSVDLIRVVDSSSNQYCLEAITPKITSAELDLRHFDNGSPISPLGRMIHAFGLSGVSQLSGIIGKDPRERPRIWVQIYRELSEWAVLLELLRERQFATDTVILFDGFLRSKKFDKGFFGKFQGLVEQAIADHFRKYRRRVYVAGIAKRSKFLDKYRLAMALEGVMRNAFPCFAMLDDGLQATAYAWEEIVTGGGEGEGFNAGQTYLVKFGSHFHDPVWAVDILRSQSADAPTVLSYLLFDAQEGFPIPLYPMCLQRAHESATLSGFDQDILHDEVIKVVREVIGSPDKWIVDELALQPTDVGALRY